ncbi:hypothetical protein B0H15DRAFT_33495 [Mycena belliarum]|uniref:TEA domain-containing protein n=1 Tax=Mycena belliarum TaxID=1033014 RepID=A0AAD6UFI5_9AGAR|nr:hypothetical protein B0H15DRAFT_33495 [Mycena belliae]
MLPHGRYKSPSPLLFQSSASQRPHLLQTCAMRGLPKRGPDGRPVWPDNATAALLESLPTYGGMEKHGKWQLMAHHIYNKTGVVVTAKQVGSKLQSLRSTNPLLMRAHAYPPSASPPIMSASRGAVSDAPRVPNRPEINPRSVSLRPVFSWGSDGHGSDDEGEPADSRISSPPPKWNVAPDARDLHHPIILTSRHRIGENIPLQHGLILRSLYPVMVTHTSKADRLDVCSIVIAPSLNIPNSTFLSEQPRNTMQTREDGVRWRNLLKVQLKLQIR